MEPEDDQDSIDSSLWLTSGSEGSEFEMSEESSDEVSPVLDDSSSSSLSDDSSGSENGYLDDDVDPSLKQPLYDGANLSFYESYLMIMQYSLRHALTKQAVSDLLNLVGLHLPAASTVSLYKLNKFFLDLYEDISFTTHFCCSSCHSLLEATDSTGPNGCVGPPGPAQECLTISLEAQLKRKLKGMSLDSEAK